MTRSNFDPGNPDSERIGRGGLEQFLGPEAERGSQMPGEVVDGEVEEEDAPEDNEMSHEELSAEEAARRLGEMSEGENVGEELPGNNGQGE